MHVCRRQVPFLLFQEASVITHYVTGQKYMCLGIAKCFY